MFDCCGPNPSNGGDGFGGSSSPGNGTPPTPKKSSSSNNNNSNAPNELSPNFGNSSPSAKNQRDFFRYVGIQVIAPGAGGGYHFELSGVEFYGTMMTMSGQ